ncbi:MAG: tRNA (adenosine(37)-N6)-dimethylallyltransferase MiaA [Candidatus Pacebacteria bacterium]|nr:tRNA (adenosine(37)-N6)-dimethylallyltransferase MiaA [Candidatus Paceibacterota bacterium]
MQEPLKKIVVIVGPTASGKSSLAVHLASHFNGEVISADSRQVYRTLDIGTEKITEEEKAGIPHHLIDIVEPETIYTASDFLRDADAAIDDITIRHKLPIVAGGTLFYVDSLLGNFSHANVPPNRELRAHLEQRSNDQLYAKLLEKDPTFAASVDKHNPRRLIRALEIIEAKGKVPGLTPQKRYEALIIGIDIDRDLLRERIATRLKETLTRGLIEETKKLLAAGVSKERLNEIGLEYRIVLEYFDKLIPEAMLEEKLVNKVWQYAKRQRTWLKRMENVQWINVGEKERAVELVRGFLEK